MRKLFTFLIVLCLGAMNSLAQTTVTIGTGTTSNAPIAPIYRYSAATVGTQSKFQFLYTAAELAAAGINSGDVITKLAWKKANSGATNGNATFSIYMKNSALSSLVFGLNWGTIIPSYTQVYHTTAQTIPAATGWVVFNLNTPFTYTGGSLEIANDWDINMVPQPASTGSFTWYYTGGLTFNGALGNAGYPLGDWTTMTTSYGGTNRPNIQITVTPAPACSGTPNPGNTLSSVSAACSGASFTLSLQNTVGSAATYQWQSSPDGNAPWTNLGTYSAINTSQTAATYYRCQVTCGGNTDFSAPLLVTLQPFYNCYCTSRATQFYAEEISNVTVGPLNNSSDSSTIAPGYGSINQEYSNYCGFVSPPDLKRGTAIPSSISAIETGGGQSTLSTVKIFIDYNQNVSFAEAGDLAYTSTPEAGNDAPYTLTGVIVTPASASLGLTVLRVICNVAPSAQSVGPCGESIWGETEDYLVNIIDAPLVVTTDATSVTATEASLNGSVNPRAGSTSNSFEWGLTTSYGNTVTATPPHATGTSAVPISTLLTGIFPNTTYHYRAKGDNNAGTVYGSDFSFTTPAIPPTVVTNAATLTLPTQATLNGTVTANYASTNVTFEWGHTSAYGNTATAGPSSVTGGAATPVLAVLTGLTPNSTYHYRCVGVNSLGMTTYGLDQVFYTQCSNVVPAITGPASVCISSSKVYTTEPGMSSYNWTVSAGGTITAGAGTNSISVTWAAEGTQSVSVSYTNTLGCPTNTPTLYPVTVNALPVPTITGPNVACESSSYLDYITQTGMTNYIWSMSPNSGTISVPDSNVATIFWNSPGAKWVSISYTNANGCTAASPTVYNVTVNPLPATPATITGASTVCAGASGVVYSVPAVTNADSYTWTLPSGTTIASGAGTSSITVNFGTGAVSGNISVVGVNTCGPSQTSSDFPVTVNVIPVTPVITLNANILSSSAASGNQWYHDGLPISGATAQTYTVVGDGTYTAIVTLNNCSSEVSNSVAVIHTSVGEANAEAVNIYPNPNKGAFWLSIATKGTTLFTIQIINSNGSIVHQYENIEVNGTFKQYFDLKGEASGIYSIILRSDKNVIIRKIVIN